MGTDHGRLALQLVLCGKCPFVYATDIREAPLAKAKVLANRFQIEDKMLCVLTNGLQGLPAGEIDDVVIAGMGGETIGEIISDAPWLRDDAKNLVLVPANGHDFLRSYLFANGFLITKEVAVEAKGRVYTVIQSKYSGEVHAPTLKELYIGSIIEEKTNAAKNYVEKVLRLVQKEVNGKAKAGRFELQQLKQLEQELMEVLTQW